MECKLRVSFSFSVKCLVYDSRQDYQGHGQQTTAMLDESPWRPTKGWGWLAAPSVSLERHTPPEVGIGHIRGPLLLIGDVHIAVSCPPCEQSVTFFYILNTRLVYVNT